MKKLYVLLIFVFIYCAGSAQSRTTTVEYQKINRDAVVTDLPYPEKTVLLAIRDTMDKLGYSGKESKGFLVFRGVKMPALGSGNFDLYFSADRKSKKEKDASVLTMMVSKGDDNFISADADPGIISNAKSFLNDINPQITRFDLEMQITDQEDIVRKEEKKANNLAGDADDLQKKKKKIEDQIEENIKDQARQKEEVEKQKVLLESLKAKRNH